MTRSAGPSFRFPVRPACHTETSTENRVAFGRTKVDKAASKREAERARRVLEGKKRD